MVICRLVHPESQERRAKKRREENSEAKTKKPGLPAQIKNSSRINVRRRKELAEDKIAGGRQDNHPIYVLEKSIRRSRFRLGYKRRAVTVEKLRLIWAVGTVPSIISPTI